MHQHIQHYLWFILVNSLLWVQTYGATFRFVYLDAPGFGFNDNTPVEAVGGNNGTTLGQQRKNILRKATDILAVYLQSDVEISIEARFQILPGSEDAATLASGGPLLFFTDFNNSPIPDVYYAAALANSLAKEDLDTNVADISLSINESVDSNPNVLGGRGFYYGYDNNTGDQSNLMSTLLHELGHGLGFISSIDPSNGSFIFEQPDSFSLLIKDLKSGKLWNDMSNSEREVAVSNDPAIVFSGATTQQAMRRILKPESKYVSASSESGMRLSINHSVDLMQSFAGEAPIFGFGVPPWGLSGQLVLVEDGVDDTSDACEGPFANADAIRGRIAVINRGTCLFVEKIKRVQDAGAIAAVVINHEGDELLIMDVIDDEVIIPSIFIGQSDGDVIKRTFLGAQVTLFNRNQLNGTQDGWIRLYTPNPAEFNSSLSHWSSDTFPDLLMEPENSNFTRPDLDLTLTALRDIGWSIEKIPIPHLSFQIWASEMIQGANMGLKDDPDDDGAVNLLEYAFGTNPEDPTDRPNTLKFRPSVESPEFYILEYSKSITPADIIWKLSKTDDLTVPFTPASNGSEYQEIGQSIDADGRTNVSIQIESNASKQFFSLQAELYTE